MILLLYDTKRITSHLIIDNSITYNHKTCNEFCDYSTLLSCEFRDFQFFSHLFPCNSLKTVVRVATQKNRLLTNLLYSCIIHSGEQGRSSNDVKDSPDYAPIAAILYCVV